MSTTVVWNLVLVVTVLVVPVAMVVAVENAEADEEDNIPPNEDVTVVVLLLSMSMSSSSSLCLVVVIESLSANDIASNMDTNGLRTGCGLAMGRLLRGCPNDRCGTDGAMVLLLPVVLWLVFPLSPSGPLPVPPCDEINTGSNRSCRRLRRRRSGFFFPLMAASVAKDVSS